jgi:hypothetical protein
MKVIDWVKLSRMSGELNGMSEAIEMTRGEVKWEVVAREMKSISDDLMKLSHQWMGEVEGIADDQPISPVESDNPSNTKG